MKVQRLEAEIIYLKPQEAGRQSEHYTYVFMFPVDMDRGDFEEHLGSTAYEHSAESGFGDYECGFHDSTLEVVEVNSLPNGDYGWQEMNED